jgi:SAM-dependent methyltransferase
MSRAEPLSLSLSLDLRLDQALAALSAAGEETRLRILALIAETELTVSELVAILGQSQPRVSRHLKLLVESGLAIRQREGAWAFFRTAVAGPGADLGRALVSRLDPRDPVFATDRGRLDEIRRARDAQAARYFAAHAGEWDHLRSLHVPETQVEAVIADMVGHAPIRLMLDCGTGTGRMLELLAGRADRAIGVDLSPAMLAVARANLERAGVRNAQLRQGDIYALPVERNACDFVLIHQVLHYLEDPGRALREAARVLAPGGRLMVVDFAPHEQEHLRERHAHRRLGFAGDEISHLLQDVGLDVGVQRNLAPRKGEADKLTVSLWLARDPRVIADPLPAPTQEFA